MHSIIRGRYIFTEVSGRDNWISHEDAAILTRDGIVEKVGRYDDFLRDHPAAITIGDGQQVVIPGLVNSHHHIGLTPLQHGVPDLPLELWTNARVKLRAVDYYLDTLYSAFEMLASGVTTVQHIRPGSAGGDPGQEAAVVDEILRAYSDVGLRVSFAHGVRTQNRLHNQLDDSEFLQSLPSSLRAGASAFLARFGVSIEEFFEIFGDLRTKYAGRDDIRIQLAPPNLHWLTDSAIERFADYSQKHDIRMHLHLDETPYQKEYAKRRGGGSSYDYMERFGFTNHRLTIGHAVWMCESDLEKAAAAGVNICHNCSSNLRLQSGIAPLNEFEKRGINVALGIDEAGLNDDRDMLQEMRLVLKLHRIPGMFNEVPTPGQVLRMGTIGGALTTAFGDQVGSLKVGSFADCVLIDWRDVSYPYLHPDTSVLDAVIQRAKTSAVRTVVVGGKTIYADGQFTRIDHSAAIEKLAEFMKRELTDADITNAKLASDLVPHVKQFYRDYISTQHMPFTIYNSRS